MFENDAIAENKITHNIRLGISQYRVARNSEVLICPGLGSCLAVVFYDRTSKIGGAAHVMLPTSRKAKISEKVVSKKGKYADTAVEVMLKKMESWGSKSKNIKAGIFGGANMFPNLFYKETILNIGERNIESAKGELAARGIELKAEDTGGHSGRTVLLYVKTGKVEVKMVDGKVREWKL
ncbi:MAG: chemotaxis protein CheD [Armatimonadota bacterium]